MGISSGGFGRPFPLGPALVQTRTTCQGQPGAACPLSGCLGSHLGAQRPVARPAPGGGAVRYCVPFGWSRLLRGLGAQRPVAPPARRGSPFLPRNGEKEGRGPLSSVGSSVGTIAGWTLQRGFPADSGGGARLSLEKVGGKNTRAPPWTRVFMAARSHSLVFGIVVSDTIEGLFRSGF